jgi:superfamily II DNA/RNA helicase
VDVEAVKMLSPNSFKDRPEADHEAIARQIQTGLGTMKEEALNRVVNQFDWKKNAKIGRAVDIIEKKVYEEANPKTASQAGDRKPGVIFAHNIQTVENLRAALSAKGCRVGIIQGSMNGAEKEKVKVGFNPPNPKDRIYDIILCSDAGATGLNLQNAAYLMNFDLPQTSWVKQQREGRIDRMGQAHKEIEYHDIVSDTEHEKKKWERIQRKKALGSIFEEDPGVLDDTGLAATIAAVRQDRYNQGIDKEKAA